jgi:1-phosphofructokinase
MIVTLTANPSLDRTVALPGPLERGEVQRAVSVSQESGGKGVNVSRALVASGLETVAVLPGGDSDPVLAGLRDAGVPFAALAIHEPLRTNVALTEPGGVTTKINEPGPVLGEDAQEALIELLLERAKGASWVVLAGSLPPGVPNDFYATVTRRLRSADTGNSVPQIAVDSSGAPLAAAIAGDASEAVSGSRRRRRAFRCGGRVGNARFKGRCPCDGRRRVAGHASAGHRGQYGRRGRFVAGWLSARRQPGRRPG